MKIQFNPSIDDPEVLDRLRIALENQSVAIENQSVAIDCILPVLKERIKCIECTYIKGEFNQELYDLMIELYCSGNYDFYQAVMCTRALNESKIILSFALYPVLPLFLETSYPVLKTVRKK